MIDMLARQEIQVLRRADHTWKEIATLTGVSVSTAQRVVAEDAVTTVNNAAERAGGQWAAPPQVEQLALSTAGLQCSCRPCSHVSPRHTGLDPSTAGARRAASFAGAPAHDSVWREDATYGPSRFVS